MFEQALTFDLETGTNTLNKRKASPFHPDNYIVAAGYKEGNNDTSGTYHSRKEPVSFANIRGKKLLIGFNIKFDLLYTWANRDLQEFFKAGGQIWDCQYVEYLLEGMLQHSQMMSMNECIPKYGGTLKLDAVKTLWDAGVDTPDIPEDLLMKYLLGDEEEELEGDVNNTWLIFIGQMRRVAKDFPPATLQMLRNRMDGLLATTEMEYNGLMLDIELGNKLREEQKLVLNDLDKQLEAFIPELPPELTFNWNSNFHKSYLIFGGLAAYEKWVQHTDEEGNGLYAKKTEKHYLVGGVPIGLNLPDGTEPDRFKGGKRAGEAKTKNVQVPDLTKPKGAKQDFSYRFEGFTIPKIEWKSKAQTDASDKPIFSTATDIIEELAATRNIPFIKTLQTRGKLKKDLGTYYWDENAKGERKGMLTLVGEDGIIHHKLNHTSTKTSRLSSSDPNAQNIPKKDKSDVKKLFISRFKDGKMAEIDYSQLEVVVQGILSRDPQLLKDLRNKIDFHCKRLATKLGEDYEEVVRAVKEGRVHHVEETIVDGKTVELKITYKDLRGDIKSFTFARAYGAGAIHIALDTGMSIDEVKALIEAEDKMYPGVIAFDKTVEASINATREPTNHEIYAGGERHQLGRGYWFSPTGTKYIWTEYETPKFLQDRGKYTGFKPTERKNYPIQGTGGEIVQTMVGILWRWLIKNDRFGGNALLVNTVHDCVWLDLADDETVAKVVPTACKILEAVPEKFNRDFNLHIDVPFPVEAEVGDNMFNLTHYET